jgi:AcrR family transcriptional regulator
MHRHWQQKMAGADPGARPRVVWTRPHVGVVSQRTTPRSTEREDAVSVTSVDSPTAASRGDRRRARTRQSLVDAAVQLMAAGRGGRASIHEITDAADVGLGSFYNHFASKQELFESATEEVLERWGRMIDGGCAGLEDPAEVFAVSLRLSGRLASTHPEIAGFITGSGLALLDAPRGLAPRALRDIRAGQAVGRFTVADAEVALSAVLGGLLGLPRVRGREPRPVDESSVDELTEACLRLLGVGATEARRLARLPIPAAKTWEDTVGGRSAPPRNSRSDAGRRSPDGRSGRSADDDVAGVMDAGVDAREADHRSP